MSKKIETQFTFYPVGQGCFYTGSIKTETNEFVIVYDCGTVSKEDYLNGAIDEFKSKHDKIDLLMISHFDKDHVNGLKRLLSGMVCELVVIPYYLPIVRLALYGSNGPNDDDDDDDDYGLFITDPTNYFLDEDKFNVNQVIVLENGNENHEDFIKAPEPNSPEKQFELIEKILLDKVKENDEEFKNRVISEEENESSSNEKIKYLSLPFKLSISNDFWEFVFYLKNFNKPTGLDNFREEINRMLTKTRDGKLSSLFDEVYILKIKELYKEHLSSDINYTSLVVYHGSTKSYSFAELWIDWCGHFESAKNIGTLLTGDSFLKTTNDFNSFFNYYSPYYIKNCFFFQVPHHGSKRNWKNLPNGLENIPFYIINHGWGRKKHPNKDVIDNIITNYNGNLIYNNEASRVTYCMNIR